MASSDLEPVVWGLHHIPKSNAVWKGEGPKNVLDMLRMFEKER